jgi:hypothetical protein
MNTILLTRVCFNFSKRVPSIKFVGPRHLQTGKPAHNQSTSTTSSSSAPRKLSDLSKSPAMYIPSISGGRLSALDI